MTTDGPLRAGDRRSWRLAALGLVTTLLLAGLNHLGIFTGLERRSVDLRMTHLPRPARPMTDEIVHVDIDDSAIDRIGRWPWDRTTIAEAVDELVRAGAATIALDLILSEAQFDAHVADSELTNDGRLAMSLSQARAVVPVVLHEAPLFHSDWRGESAETELDRLMQLLAEDVQRDDEAVAREAGLTGGRRRRYLERPMAFRQAAVWRAIRSAAPTNWTEFERRLAPARSAIAGDYPERAVLR